MDERWRRLQEIFDAAVELEPAERTAYLQEVCGGDHDLLRELEAMLAMDDHASALLDAGIRREAELLSEAASTTLIGQNIGPYVLTGLLGRGGMGTVYLALRNDGLYDKPVALKLINRGMNTDEIIRRFHQERRILSRLDHPNIARLLDGGTTADGLPYFVMEQVEGEPITSYSRTLPLRERLALFRQICDAVDYAHRNLVVHRDLKPGNILVTPSRAPKLLDFGIAKLLTPEESGQTQAGWQILTPDYASPEQKLGQPVTIVSDVYSLGRILEETLAEDCRSGELRNIVEMALRENPDRRYTSAAQLSDDVRRYLQGLPVAAREDTFFYRAGKFISRNRIAVSVSVIAATTVLAAGMFSAVRAHQLRQEVEQERRLATAMLFEINEEIRMLPGSIKVRERLVRTGLEFLDAAARKIGADPDLEWELAQGYEAIANLQGGPHEGQSNLGDIDGAKRSHRTALEMTKSLLIRDPHRAELRSFEAMLHDNLGRLSEDPAESMQHFRESLRIATSPEDFNAIERARMGFALAHLAAGDPRSAMEFLPRRTVQQTWATKALVLKAAGDLPRALAVAREGVVLSEGDLASARTASSRRLAQGAAATAHAFVGEILGDPFRLNLGDRLGAIRELRIAARLAEENAALEPGDGVVISDLASILVRLAEAIADRSPAESVELYQRAILSAGRLRKLDLLRREFPDTLVTAHWQISYPLRQLGRRDEALRHLRRSLELYETAPARNALGSLRMETGDHDGALKEFQRALAVAEKELSTKATMMPLRRDLADTLENIGRWHESAKRPADARECWSRSIAAWRDWPNFGLSSSFNTRRAEQAARALSRLGRRS